jgi:ADP-dependent NAD(P)H-hydrate dehydratase / NAD(P)H-hydrate epimerase
MKILTAAEMGEADRRSVEAGISIATLMENAGRAVARFCERHYTPGGLVVVLCGKGNNGGDGFVAARHLAVSGRTVRVLLLGAAADVKGDAAAALASLRNLNRCEVREVADEAALAEAIHAGALIVDAVVGTGFKPPLRGLAAVARDLVANINVPVIAVDLPSGWDADSLDEKNDEAFRADSVVTFTAPKKAHVFGHLTTATFGAVVVADIGSPEEAVHSASGLTWAGASKAIAEKPRDVNGNKGRFGHVLVVGGSWGKSGAPSMASIAAMRAGAGLVTAAVPSSILPMVASVAAELMCVPLAERDGSVELANAEPQSLEKLLKGIKVVAVGSGLGTDGEASEFARALVERCSVPMVIDADALNAFAGSTDLLRDAAREKTLVLTPHPGEMARLLGLTVKEVEADRVGIARKFATEHGVTLVLKGWRTLIAHPDGRIAVNTTGNPSMAKGGSGDILTGIVAAMLAQYSEDVGSAVEAAVFLHGLAGDFAVRAQDEHTVLATDTVAHLWEAFRARVEDPDGFTWIAGTVMGFGERRA